MPELPWFLADILNGDQFAIVLLIVAFIGAIFVIIIAIGILKWLWGLPETIYWEVIYWLDKGKGRIK